MTCESCIQKDSVISELRKRIEQLDEHNKKLEEQIRQIASKIWKPRHQTTNPRKQGPPKNHKPHNRPVPTDIHRKETLSLDTCPECHHPLSTPVRTRTRYVEDISPPEPFNTEYTIPSYWCRHCRKQVSPTPADAIPKCRFGTRLLLLITFLRYGILLPLNKIARELEIVYGIRLSEGALVDALDRFADYLGPEFEELTGEVRNAAAVHADETGWRINGENHWLWDFITRRHALFVIDKRRSSDVPRDVLGTTPDRTVICDSFAAYDRLGGNQQKCWAHILRNSRRLGGDGGILHYKLKRLYRQARRYKGTGEAARIKAALELAIDQLAFIPVRDKKSSALVKTLVRHKESLFRFMVEDIDATNNAAERGLRPSVVMRKITGGNRSGKGAENHARVMSVMETWKKQGKEFFAEGERVIREARAVGE